MKQIKLISWLYLWIYHYVQAYDLFFIFMGILINVDRINAISACMNAILQQVKLSTTKLTQNKDENKNSKLWNDYNWSETKFNLLFFDRLMGRDAR